MSRLSGEDCKSPSGPIGSWLVLWFPTEKDLETASWLSQLVGFGFFLPLPLLLPFALCLSRLVFLVQGTWNRMKHRNNNNMWVVSCARILARCHIQIVFSLYDRFAPKWDAGSTATPTPTPASASATPSPALPGCVPVHLAASLCWRPLFEWHLNLCIDPNRSDDSLFHLQGRQFVVGVQCRLDRHKLYDRRHYAMTSLWTRSTSRCFKDQQGIQFCAYSKLKNWINSRYNWDWNCSSRIWIITTLKWSKHIREKYSILI